MRTAPQTPQVVVSSVARTTSGNSGVIDGWGGRSDLVSKLVISAVSGTTPSMTVTIEHADVAGGPFTAVDTYPAQTATTTGITRNIIGASKPFVRVAWAITGTTPSFTFSVAFGLTSSLVTVG